ncbi:hypothetical protein [Halohasta litorea]|uniref:Uncharacterized protein n=1 Tax=Halohasta litorea TaxID=869891 RepID=A0ABD6D9N4_9EURY|nr:hypothetical protein [Halohasta litorea]
MDGNITDSPVDWDNVDYEGISEFIKEKGAVELLAFLDGFGYRFEEIDDALDISRGYINDRRDEALNLDLIYPTQEDRDGTIRRVWALSPLGMIIVYRMRINGVRQIHDELVSVRKNFQEKKDEFLDWSGKPENIEDFADEIIENKDVEKGSEFSVDLKVSTSKPDDNPFDR